MISGSYVFSTTLVEPRTILREKVRILSETGSRYVGEYVIDSFINNLCIIT